MMHSLDECGHALTGNPRLAGNKRHYFVRREIQSPRTPKTSQRASEGAEIRRGRGARKEERNLRKQR